MSDPFSKLIDAQKTFLNPTLDLITSNQPLHQHCYYLLSRYPPSDSTFWTNLETSISTPTELPNLIAQVTSSTATQIPLKDHMLSNLNLALTKSDTTYLQYLLAKQPKKRTTLTLVRKNPMINPDLATSINVTQSELNELSSTRLKLHLHRYIKTQQLQDENQVTIDNNIINLLGLPNEEYQSGKQLHYFTLLGLFNKKYLPH